MTIPSESECVQCGTFGYDGSVEPVLITTYNKDTIKGATLDSFFTPTRRRRRLYTTSQKDSPIELKVSVLETSVETQV